MNASISPSVKPSRIRSLTRRITTRARSISSPPLSVMKTWEARRSAVPALRLTKPDRSSRSTSPVRVELSRESCEESSDMVWPSFFFSRKRIPDCAGVMETPASAIRSFRYVRSLCCAEKTR
ncbi:MAG: hypothetical protein A4E73_00451 [Syntrophaceae bacterium PtaU1.Bin231]|nr:MAG: hypothetical protein A4E73_00451 [Syntrophaceae bacterium PtaU1.Bin231]